jgi:hypothetical protein
MCQKTGPNHDFEGHNPLETSKILITASNAPILLE